VHAIQLDGQIRIYQDLLSEAEYHHRVHQAQSLTHQHRPHRFYRKERLGRLWCAVPGVRLSAACRLPA